MTKEKREKKGHANQNPKGSFSIRELGVYDWQRFMN